MNHSDNIHLIAPALVKAQSQFPEVSKDGKAEIVSKRTGGKFGYTYATLPDVQRAVLPVLAANGIFVTQGTVEEDSVGFAVETTLVHESGQWTSTRVRIPIETASAQATGSAYAYGRRVGLVGALGIVTDDEDDDGAKATEFHARTPAERNVGGQPSQSSRSTGTPSGSSASAASSKPSTTGTLAAPGTSVLMPGLPTWFRNMAGQPIQDVPDTILGEAEAYYAKKVNAGGKYADTNKECLSTIQAEIARRDALIPDDGDPGPSEY